MPVENKQPPPPQQGERLAPAEAVGEKEGPAAAAAPVAPKPSADEPKKKPSSRERKPKRKEAAKSPEKIKGRFETEIDTQW
jgi:hypothetical protein